jgi:hypothetical protein
MSGSIEEVINHLVASNINSGEAMAAIQQARDLLQEVHGKVQESQDHVSIAMGNTQPASLQSSVGVLYSVKLTLELAIAGMEPIPNMIAQSQEINNEYIGRLQG